MFGLSFRDFDAEYVITPRWGWIDEPDHDPLVLFEAEQVLVRYCRSLGGEHHLRRLLDSASASLFAPEARLEDTALAALERGDIRVFRSTRVIAFTSATGGESEAGENEEAAPPVTHWIQIEVVDDEGTPIPNVVYELTLPNRRVMVGRTNAQGVAYVSGIDPGQCTLRLPYVHEDAWKAA
jgi:hypothetical protein